MGDGKLRRGSERRPIALQVRLAFGDVGEFVERYAVNISEGGIFIRSREPRPVGSKLRFELHLRTGEVVFAGEGTVRWRQLPDARGLGVAGMGLQFDNITDESRAVLHKILDLREEEQAPPPVEGASPASWRPLEEFPPPPVEPEEEKTLPPPPPPMMKPAAQTAAPSIAPISSAPIGRVQLVSRGISLGIDFGWSTIRVGTAMGEKGRRLPVVGDDGMPALVADLGSRWVVGDAARIAIAQGARGIRGIGHLLGQWAGSPGVQAWERRQLVKVVAGADGRAALQLAGSTVSVDEIVTALLRTLKTEIETRHRTTINHAVFAVPGGWGDGPRRALRQAATAAGFQVDGLVSAAVASTLACHGTRGRRRLLSLHFGEGVYEAAIVEQSGHVFDLVSSATDFGLGGADLDIALVGAMLGQFEQETGFLVPEDPLVFERVRAAAAEVKERLSESLEVDLLIPALVESGLSKAELRQKVTRAKLLQVANPMLERAIELSREALRARSLGGADLDEVLLFGGQSEFTPLARRVAEKIGREPARPDSADDAPAIGAALIAEGSTQLGRYVVAGAVGGSVVIGLPGGGVRRIIERNLPLPVERGYTIATGLDGQREIELHLFQGESPRCFENEYVGALIVGPLPPLPKGECRATLTLSLNDAGELSARGRDVTSGQPIPVTIDRTRLPDAAQRALLPS